MQLRLFYTPFCTISAPFPPSSCPFPAISPLLYSLILRLLSIKYHIMKTYFNVIITFHENTLFYIRFTPKKTPRRRHPYHPARRFYKYLRKCLFTAAACCQPGKRQQAQRCRCRLRDYAERSRKQRVGCTLSHFKRDVKLIFCYCFIFMGQEPCKIYSNQNTEIFDLSLFCSLSTHGRSSLLKGDILASRVRSHRQTQPMRKVENSLRWRHHN